MAGNGRDSNTTEGMTVRDALTEGQVRLRAAGVPDAVADLEYFLTHLLGCQRHELYTEPGRVLTPDERGSFAAYLARRTTREPVQHISGEVEFYGRSFRVTQSTLIPRPETELLTYTAVKIARELHTPGRPLTIIDLCTGSGCVAVTLAAELAGIPGLRIIASDISEEAVSAAAANARALGVSGSVEFFAGDLFAPLSPARLCADVIVANPPYIETADIAGLEPEVRDFEPLLALDGGADGLSVIRRILRDAPWFLAPGGVVVMEIGYGQSGPVADIVRADGIYCEPEFTRDFSGIERIVRLSPLKAANDRA